MKTRIVVAIVLVKLLLIGGYILFNSNKKMKNHNEGQGQTTQSQSGYTAQLISGDKNIKPKTDTTISYFIKNEKGDVLKDFAVGHEKIMHFIVIRKDLQYFQHLHPEFNKETGQFTTTINFPDDGPYRLFPDFIPGASTDNPVTLNVDLQVGDANNYKETILNVDAGNQDVVEGYQITHLFPDGGIKSKEEVTYSLLVEKNGQPVDNLENYLGAKGHSVILKAGTMDYIHTHAIEEGAHEGHHGSAVDTSENKINFATSFPDAGIYKIFTQFQHEGKVITTDYTIQVN